MVDRMMFPIPFQGLIAPKGIGVIDRPLSGLGFDMSHEFFGTHGLNDFGIDTRFPLQEPKDDAFPCGRSASFALPFDSKVGFIQLDLAFELSALQFSQMIQGFSHSLIDPRDHFDIHSQILGQPIAGLQLIEPLENRDLPTQPTQTFTLSTQLAFHIASTGVQDLEGTTENTLASAQKVGRTTKNGVSSSNHAPFLAHIGYETP
jgi:hypothetical protein